MMTSSYSIMQKHVVIEVQVAQVGTCDDIILLYNGAHVYLLRVTKSMEAIIWREKRTHQSNSVSAPARA